MTIHTSDQITQTLHLVECWKHANQWKMAVIQLISIILSVLCISTSTLIFGCFSFFPLFFFVCVFESFVLPMKGFLSLWLVMMIHHYWLFLLVLQLKLNFCMYNKFVCYDSILTNNNWEMNLIKKSTNFLVCRRFFFIYIAKYHELKLSY